jgi:branched-chain amino acid transport system substrate-binding protein
MLKRTLLAVSPLLLALGCEPPAGPPIEPVRIGALIDLTGAVVGELGLKMRDASTLAVEQINASGGVFDGRPIELVFGDTEGDPANAASEARRLHDEEGVVALVGPLTSGEVTETIPVLEGIELTAISPSATAPPLTASSEWFLRTTPNDLLQGEAIAHVAAKGTTLDNGNDVAPCAETALLFRGDPYGTSLAAVFREEYPLRTVGDTGAAGDIISDVEYADSALADETLSASISEFFNTIVTNHDAAVPRLCVFLIAFPSEGAQAVEELSIAFNASLPAVDVQYYGPDALNQSAFAIESNAFSEILVTAPTHANNTGYDEFKKSLRARFGDEEPGNFTFNMYDAIILTGLAITASESTDSRDILDALYKVAGPDGPDDTEFEGEFFGTMAEALLSGENIDYTGPSGALDFDEDGDVLGDYGLHRARQVDQSTFIMEPIGSISQEDFGG